MFSQYQRSIAPIYTLTANEMMQPYNTYRILVGTTALLPLRGISGGEDWIEVFCFAPLGEIFGEAIEDPVMPAYVQCEGSEEGILDASNALVSYVEIMPRDRLFFWREQSIEGEPNSGRWHYNLYRETSIPSPGTSSAQIYSEEVAIPRTAANTDVTVIASTIKRVVDIKYIFPSAIAGLIRLNTALIGSDRVTLNGSLDLENSKVIFIGNL